MRLPCIRASSTPGVRVQRARAALLPSAARRHMEHAPFHPAVSPRRAVVKDAAAVQHDDARTARGLVQIGRRPDDGHAVVAQFADHLPQLLPRQGVHAHAGFIQQQHARRPQQGAGDAQFLLHAAGKASGQTAGERPQRGEGQQPVEQGIAGLALQTAQTGVQAQIGHDGKVFIQAETLRHVADAVGRVRRHLTGGTTEQQGLPRRRFHEPGQQAQQGGLARAVRPHETGDAPCPGCGHPGRAGPPRPRSAWPDRAAPRRCRPAASPAFLHSLRGGLSAG